MESNHQHMHPLADFGDDVFIYRWIKCPKDDRRTFWCLGFYKAVSLFAATLPQEDNKPGSLYFLNTPPMTVWTRM